MSARKQVSAGVVVGFAMNLLSTAATAQVVYDLGDFPFGFSGPATEVKATLQTSTTGIFTTEAAIENFLNLATYSIVLKNGPTTILQLDNANSTWDIQFGGTGATATLTATPSKITLDFSTPNETSDAALILGPPPPGIAQYRQANNVTDFNFVNIDAATESTADATVAYDAPFIFPAISAPVPAPALSLSALGLLAGLLSGLGIRTMRRRCA